MKPGTSILFSNEATQDHAKNQEPFWGVIKDTIVQFGSTCYLTAWIQPNEKNGDQIAITIVRPDQIQIIED